MITIKVPQNLIFESSIEFAKRLNEVKECKKVIIDFAALSRIDPFSLLFISSEIQRFRWRFQDIDFSIANYKHCTYQAHMGFFNAFGAKFGNYPGEAKGSNTYIPIKIYDTDDIIKEAKDRLINPAELMEMQSKEIANILTRSNKGDINEVITYCMREMFRNVIEHSGAEQFGFCAQYIPSMNKVSFAIIDRGIGLKKSLSSNPRLKIDSDEDAIREALKPAVSGKVYKGQKRKPKGEWANSGYGLHMTSQIVKQGGGFFIASGNTGYYLSENRERVLETPFMGTALNIAIDTRRIYKLDTMLRMIDEMTENTEMKPSKSTMGLKSSRN